MLRSRLFLPLTLIALTACASGDDDDIVQIRDGGVTDAGTRDAGADAGVSVVEIRTLSATFETQGCGVPCVIADYQINVTLGNFSDTFAIARVTDVEVSIGTFEMRLNNFDCNGAWWQAPKNGMTALQMIDVNLFDVPDDDPQRVDRYTMTFDCRADADQVLLSQYELSDRPSRGDNMVTVRMAGALEDGSTWEAEDTVVATCSDVPCF